MDYLLKDVTITANYHFGKDYTSSVIFEFFVRMHEDIETRLKVCTKDHGFSWENNSTRNKRADMIAFFFSALSFVFSRRDRMVSW